MSIREEIEDFVAPGPTPSDPRTAAPKGFEPGIRFDSGGRPLEITTDLVSEAPTEDEWRHIVEGMGITMPEGWRLVLVEARFDPVAWTRDQPFKPGTEPVEDGGDGRMQKMPALTRPAWRYRFRVEQAGAREAADRFLELIDRWRPKKKAATDLTADFFTAIFADMQIGKWEASGGTERTVERVLDLVDQAVAEYRALAKKGLVGPVCLVFPGDGCEGFISQNGRLVWRTDLAPSEMVRVYRRLLQHAVLEFAKVAPAVTVVIVPGNHDETTRAVATHHSDSWDVEAAAATRDGLALSPEKFGHVGWLFPSVDKDVVTIDLAGTLVAVAHGHQFKGGAETWWAKQAHGRSPAGSATLLISGHFHHLRVVETGGGKTWIQCPALDNGSEWFTRERGECSPSGLLTLAIGRGGWDRLRVLTWEGDATA